VASPARDTAAFFQTRGVVIVPEDLTLRDWPERACRAGLSTLALHSTSHPAGGANAVAAFVRSDAGQAFLASCRALGLEVEYELHAMKELLPRGLFGKSPALFRMNEQGERTPDANLCVHSPQALEIVAENAVAISRALRPTTGRHFLWGDDGQPWCRCTRCCGLSDSDQALLLGNRMLGALQRDDPAARLAHLAYGTTLWPPRQVRPRPGIFLEFAPLHRRHDIPYAAQDGVACKDSLAALDANLEAFGRETAQVLEYWLDASRFSGWKRPAVRIPWNREVFAADLATYGSRGIRHITTFAAWVDAAYVARHGDPPLEAYGADLARLLPRTPKPSGG